MKTSVDTEAEDTKCSPPDPGDDAVETPAASEELDSVTLYLRELVDRPALTREEERNLTAEIARAKQELTGQVRSLLLKAVDVIELDDVAPTAKNVASSRRCPSRIRAEILDEMSDQRVKADRKSTRLNSSH